MEPPVKLNELMPTLEGLGFERVGLMKGTTFRDCSTVIIVPTRGQEVPWRVANSWMQLIAPMNQKRAFLFAAGHEVGAAYNALITHILANPELSKWRYVLTLEDDNLPPPDAHIRLLETIEEGYDAVSGLYFTKGDINMPQAYGLPETYEKTGYLEFTPRNVVECLNAGKVMGVNGIAMGCALWRMDMFRDIPAPWYVTLAEWIPNEGVKVMTQDLSFCMQARKAGKRFAVDTSVKVGHLDKESGIVY